MSALDFVGQRFSGHHPHHHNHHISHNSQPPSPPHNFNFIQRPGRKSILPYASYMAPQRVQPVTACPPFQHKPSATASLMDYSCRLPPVLPINDRWFYPKHPSPPQPLSKQQQQVKQQQQQQKLSQHQHVQHHQHQQHQKPQKLHLQQHRQQKQHQQQQQLHAKKHVDGKSTRYNFTREDIDAVLYGYATCGTDKSKVSHSLSGVSSRLTKGIYF